MGVIVGAVLFMLVGMNFGGGLDAFPLLSALFGYAERLALVYTLITLCLRDRVLNSCGWECI